MASFDSVGNLGKYEERIVILREAGCAPEHVWILGGGSGEEDKIFCLSQESNAEFSSSSSVPSYTRITTELSGPPVLPYL